MTLIYRPECLTVNAESILTDLIFEILDRIFGLEGMGSVESSVKLTIPPPPSILVKIGGNGF